MVNSDGPVVVGYDGSLDADWAVDWAAVEALRHQRDLLVLFAADHPGLSRHSLTTGQPTTHAQEMAEAVTQAGVTRARAAAPDLSVTSKTTGLGAAVALTEASVGASLLVVGGRGRTRASEALLGTVQFAVTAHAECPVVVVPPECVVVADAKHPVVVGVDGSQDSNLAVRAAADAASDRGATLLVVAAWQRPPVDDWSRFYLVDDQWRQDMFAAARARVAQHVNDAAREAKKDHTDLDVVEFVVEGRPSTRLAEESVKAGLVVVGARGRSDLVSLLLGSVGHNLIHRSHCPVLVIRSYAKGSADVRMSVTPAEAEADQVGLSNVEFVGSHIG